MTAWLALFGTLLRAVAAYLELKNKRAAWDLMLDVEKECRENEIEIEKLRASGRVADQLAADRLRNRIVRLQGVAVAIGESLPTPSAGAAGGASSPNGNGSVPANKT